MTGGASVAMAWDAASAGYWNPATIRLLNRREVYIGFEAIHADQTLSSSVPAGLLGPFPTEDRAGSTEGNSGLAAIPTIAWIAGTNERPVTFGGFYDIVTCPLLITRTEPDHFLANVLIDLAQIRDEIARRGSGV